MTEPFETCVRCGDAVPTRLADELCETCAGVVDHLWEEGRDGTVGWFDPGTGKWWKAGEKPMQVVGETLRYWLVGRPLAAVEQTALQEFILHAMDGSSLVVRAPLLQLPSVMPDLFGFCTSRVILNMLTSRDAVTGITARLVGPGKWVMQVMLTYPTYLWEENEEGRRTQLVGAHLWTEPDDRGYKGSDLKGLDWTMRVIQR